MRKSEKVVTKSGKKETPIPKANMGKGVLFSIIFFISVWMFVLGVLVGRGTAPVKFDIDNIQNELADLKKNALEKERQEMKNISGSMEEPVLDFHEALKDTEFQKREDIRQKARKHKKKRVPEKKADISQAAKFVSHPGKKKTGEKSSVVKNLKRLTIQVAAVRDKNVADHLVARLKKRGYPAYRAMAMIAENNIWYRVRVGNYGSRSEAKNTLKKLQKENATAILVDR